MEHAGSSRRVDVDNFRLAVTTMGLTTEGRSRKVEGRPYGMALTGRGRFQSTMDDGAARAGAECASARNSSHRGPLNCSSSKLGWIGRWHELSLSLGPNFNKRKGSKTQRSSEPPGNPDRFNKQIVSGPQIVHAVAQVRDWNQFAEYR